MQVTIVKNEVEGNSVSTVVLRGSTDSILDDLERAVDDGVNTYKVISNVARLHNKGIIKEQLHITPVKFGPLQTKDSLLHQFELHLFLMHFSRNNCNFKC